MFQLVGSNDAVCDENSKWEVLCQDLSGTPIESMADRRSCRVHIDDFNYCPKFRCVGIKVLQNKFNADDSGKVYVALTGIRMWAYDSIRLP